MTALTHQDVGMLVKELVKLIQQEQSPTDSDAINTRIGEIVTELCWYWHHQTRIG